MKEIVITSSVLILIVLLMRTVLKGRISLRLQYALWGLVLVRLLIPFSLIASPVSVMNVLGSDTGTVSTPTDLVLPELYTDTSKDNYTAPVKYTNTPASQTDTPVGEPLLINWTDTAKYVWYAGMACVAAVLLISNINFALKLRRTRRRFETKNSPLPVYISGLIPTPCMFGLFRPAIYITASVLENKTTLDHVLAHETTHYRHGDHIWSALRGFCLIVYWFNPLVWLAAALSRRDAELACDECAISKIGEDRRIEYGRTLIGLSCEKSSAMDLICCATTMTGGKKAIVERIKMIAKKPKTAAYTLVSVILIVSIAAGCTFTGAKVSTAPSEIDEGDLGIVMEGIDAPEPVLEAAKDYVRYMFKTAINETSNISDGVIVESINNNYLDWRITLLKKTYTYERTDENNLDVYQMNYEFKVNDPEKTPLTGGMYVTFDNWLCPTYPNCTYLIFDAPDNTYLCTMMENDCKPGDELFTADMNERLSRPREGAVDLSKYTANPDLKEMTCFPVYLDYASDDYIVFDGYFGLFVYDLNKEQMALSVDLKKTVGTTVVQGSYGAGVSVSADGSVIQLCYYPETQKPDMAYLISLPDMKCSYGKYKELDSYFYKNTEIKFSDGTTGSIILANGKDEIGNLCYKRGDKTYMLFE